jgi:hypothetical protein
LARNVNGLTLTLSQGEGIKTKLFKLLTCGGEVVEDRRGE